MAALITDLQKHRTSRLGNRPDLPRQHMLLANIHKLAPEIAVTGDSRVANGFGGSAPNILAENYGWINWLTPLTWARVLVTLARTGATGGHNTADWIDNMPTYLAAGGDLFLNMISTNDRGDGFSLSRSKRNLETGLRMQIDAGKVPFLFAEMPRGGANALSAAQQSIHMGLREWVIERMPDMGVEVFDPWPVLLSKDPDEAAKGLPNLAYFVDGLHLNPMGALEVARLPAGRLIDLFPSMLPLPTYDAPYDAVSCKGGWLTPNPLLTGQGGTLSASANGTGVVADGWEVAGSAWTGATVTCSKEANPDGGEYQVFELGGTPTDAGSTLLMQFTLDIGDVANADKVKSMAKIMASGLQGVAGVSLDLRFVRSAVTYYIKSLDRYTESYSVASDIPAGVQVTESLVVDGANDTEIKVRMAIYGRQNVPLAGKVKIGNFAAFKML